MSIGASSPILRTEGVSRHYGGVAAVRSVSLAIERGSVTGIIGPNGAGKTTLLNIIAGSDRCDVGHVLLEDREITHLGAGRVAGLGVVRTFQRAGIFPTLSTLENILVGLDTPGDASFRAALAGPRWWRKAEHAPLARAWPMLERFGLVEVANDRAGTLSGGQMRLVELARAVLMSPKILLLDEPTAGVSPALIPAILELVRSMARDGVSVVMIEHDLAVVEDVCDAVVFMARGEIVATGSVREVLADPAVQAVAHGY
jgi:branched-chain amino acid transport system ATP-binding protein